jgi:hypothetical protein
MVVVVGSVSKIADKDVGDPDHRCGSDDRPTDAMILSTRTPCGVTRTACRSPPLFPPGTSSSIVASRLVVDDVGRVLLILDRPRAPAALPPSRWLPPLPRGGIIGIGLYY